MFRYKSVKHAIYSMQTNERCHTWWCWCWSEKQRLLINSCSGCQPDEGLTLHSAALTFVNNRTTSLTYRRQKISKQIIPHGHAGVPWGMWAAVVDWLVDFARWIFWWSARWCCDASCWSLKRSWKRSSLREVVQQDFNLLRLNEMQSCTTPDANLQT